VALMKEGVILFHDELDTLKDQVKRLRLETVSDLPKSFSVQGALRTEVHGRNAIVTVPSASTALVDELQDRWSARIAVEDLNLEEIFLEMHAQPTSHSN